MASSHAHTSVNLARLRRAAFATLLTMAIASVASPAAADPSAADKETARTLMDEGDKKSASYDHPAALKAYLGAHAIMGVPSTGVLVAKSHATQSQWLEALDVCLAVGRIPPKTPEPMPFQTARQECAQLAQTASGKIGSLKFVISGIAESEVSLSVDGVTVPAVAGLRRVNPGDHTIVAKARGRADVQAKVTVGTGAEVEVPLVFKSEGPAALVPPAQAPAKEGLAPRPAEAASPAQKPVEPDARRSGGSGLAVVGFVIGGVGVAAGSVTGLLAFSKVSKAKSSCTNGACQQAAQPDIDASKTMGTISTISFVVGAVGLGIGIYAISTSGPSPASATAFVGPGSVGVRGSF